MRQGAWVIVLVLAGMAPGQERSPRLGILPEYEHIGAGVLVAEVVADSPAAKAGVKAGDRITRLAGEPIKGIPDYLSVMMGLRKGDSVAGEAHLDGKETTVKAKLE